MRVGELGLLDQWALSVGSLLRIPFIRTLHERQLLFPVAIILIVAGVLVQGALEAGRAVEAADADGVLPAAPEPLPLPPDPPRRPDLEKTPLTYFDDYWGQLRERVEDRVVLVGPNSAPAVVVMPGFALTTAAAGEAVLAELDREALLRPDERERNDAEVGGGEVDAELAEVTETDDAAGDDPDGEPESTVEELPARPHGLVAVDSEQGLALFEVDIERVPSFSLVLPAAVPSGAYVGAVTRDRSGRASITPGHLVAARGEDTGDASLEVSVPLSSTGASAVVDLDGELVGVALGGAALGERTRLLSSSAVRRAVVELQRVDRCRAISVAALSPEVIALLDIEQGLLVEQVRAEAFVPEPSLRPGDIILEWDGEPVESVDAFNVRSDAIEAGTLTRYRVLRGRRRLSGGTVLPGVDCAPPVEPPVRLLELGVALRWDVGADGVEGWRVVATRPGGAAAAAGLELGDLVLTLDGRATDDVDSRASFERLERRVEPALLTLRRVDRVRIVALLPDAQ